MKSGAHFEQGGQAPIDGYTSGGGVHDPAEDLQQGGFPGTVPADDTHPVPLSDLEREVLQGPEFGGAGLLTVELEQGPCLGR